MKLCESFIRVFWLHFGVCVALHEDMGKCHSWHRPEAVVRDSQCRALGTRVLGFRSGP